ncbi:MAG: CRISPR-associated protein Csx3 [Syntrophorhabdaceae bacterium]|nr:CRISPR-associated protein Csx3 [Syntrophorhabdaceae bacterium]
MANRGLSNDKLIYKLNRICDAKGVYTEKVCSFDSEGNDVVLTGQGPIWLYLKIAHALHGKAFRLIYRSPVTGDVMIFDHSPF